MPREGGLSGAALAALAKVFDGDIASAMIAAGLDGPRGRNFISATA